MSPQTRTTAATTAAAAAAASTASTSTPILATTTGLTVTTYANSGLAPPALASFNQPDTGNIMFPPAALSAIALRDSFLYVPVQILHFVIYSIILLHTRIRYPPRRPTLSTGPTRRHL